MIGRGIGHLRKNITKGLRLILPGVILKSARVGFWLLKDELEFREAGGKALQKETYSMCKGSEAQDSVAFSGMEVHGGG